MLSFITVIYTTVSSSHTAETQARRTLVMPNLFASIVLNLAFGVVLGFLIAATDVSIVGSTSAILQYPFAVAAIVHAVMTFVFVFVRAKEARNVGNNLFNCITRRSGGYTFKFISKRASLSSEVAHTENEYVSMPLTGSPKDTVHEVEEELSPFVESDPEPDVDARTANLAKHKGEEKERETKMFSSAKKDNEAEGN